MTPVVTPTLAIRLRLQLGESVVSFVQRHCAANGITNIRALLGLLGEVDGRLLTDARLVARHPLLLHALERLTGADAGTLAHLGLLEIHGATGTFLGQGHHVCAEQVRHGRFQAVCANCLTDTGYARTGWEFTQAPVCPAHAVALVERCPTCGHQISFGRAVLTHCVACAKPFGATPSVPVGAPAAAAAALVQGPTTLSMGIAGRTIPVDVEETSHLLRLCLLPRLGEPADYGLSGRPWSYPVARRVEAISLLASTMDGRFIDSARLRPLLLQRWPYVHLLPAEQQMQMLFDTCRSLVLAPDVRNVLCHDSDESPVPTAIAVFAKRPPQLTSLEQLQRFLDVDDVLLAWLIRNEGFEQNLEDGHGYDMDAVLELQRALRALLSLAQADAILGLAGVSAALVRAGLLEAAQSRNGLVGIHPSRIVSLLSRLQAQVQEPSPETDAVPLKVGLEGFDDEQLALVVAQAIGGSLRVWGWHAPYRLTSLVVDGQRLAALRSWPSSESAADEADARRHALLAESKL